MRLLGKGSTFCDASAVNAANAWAFSNSLKRLSVAGQMWWVVVR